MLKLLYTTSILNLAANINHIGLLPNAKIKASKTSSICGSSITITANLANNKIIEYGQEVKACVLAQASAAMLANIVINATHNDIINITQEFEASLKTPPQLYKYNFLELFINAHQFPEKHEAILLPFKTLIAAFEKI